MLQLLAKTAPETWVQRLGALVFGAISLLSLLVVGGVVFHAWTEPWTIAGVWASAFGLVLCTLLSLIGIVHALTAAFPSLLGSKQKRSSQPHIDVSELNAEKLRFLYQIIGWLSLVGLLVVGYFYISH